MTRYRVGMRVLDILVVDVLAKDEDEAKLWALSKIANVCAIDEEATTVEVAFVAEANAV